MKWSLIYKKNIAIKQIEMIKTVFYRGQGAYLIGRIFNGEQQLPLVIALTHSDGGLVVDKLLLNEDEVSILFSFTRSYFHVNVERPYDLVSFLKTIMPRKRIAELYIAIGYNKHGKTELYRDLLNQLASSNDKFQIARGERGMVMVVYDMPDYDLVFKIIKDHFPFPKETTRRVVRSKYSLVFKHDRAGRLIDAQEFEHLKFKRLHFSDELLNELQEIATESVVIEENHVIVKHVYVERQVIPLNLYLEEAPIDSAKAAVVDFGNAIKDLAATNIFPGDLLLKKFWSHPSRSCGLL